MCGRISQSREPDEYFANIFTNMHKIFDPGDGLRFNVPPGSTPMVIHELAGDATLERQFWGYKPVWYKRRPVSNARLDKIIGGSNFWAPLIANGRMIMPADGWYEWVGPKGDKQPWFIRPADGQPIFMTAISAWKEDVEPGEQTGFAVVTDDTAGGMVDVHDRRPMILTAENAKEWMDPATTVDQAKELLSVARPESAFEWYEVTRKMGDSRYQGEDASEPIL